MCECSEMDWSGVDQTAAHHPDCRTVKILFGDTDHKEVARMLVFRTGGPNLQRKISLNLNDVRTLPDTHTKEACETPSFAETSRQFESAISHFIAEHPDQILGVIVSALETRSELGVRLRELLLRGR